MTIKLENCGRCCTDDATHKADDTVTCNYCGFTEPLAIWQLRGWRSLSKYPPTYGGTIFVYGKTIGRKEAKWDVATQSCTLPEATHWLRTPDPTKQIGM
jgi:hypothetical protein